MLKIPHYLDDGLTDGGEIVSLTRRPLSTSQKHFSVCATHFCKTPSKPQGLVRQQELNKFKKFIHLMTPRTRNLPDCSILPQPLRYRVPPSMHVYKKAKMHMWLTISGLRHEDVQVKICKSTFS
jgi:hypothetical protein